VRLKPEKVDDLARKISDALRAEAGVELLNVARLEHEVRRVIFDDLQREVDLNDEVDGIMKEHQAKIAGKNIDVQLLRRKIRGQLVRERKIIL
jgi:hypothetical protein